ncbi:MAG TPA: DUF4347 domain-containing protein, partial [Vicinamibacterales bacterium]|nr:DUF4347 domain-containing protein [Vicinamibacterales bacterium]
MSKDKKDKKDKVAKPKARKPAPATHPKRRSRMIALEPRMLFDGALAVDLTEAAAAAAPQPEQVKAAPEVQAPASFAESDREAMEVAPSAHPREIVFIDSTLFNAQHLAEAAHDYVEVRMLDPNRDAVTQITEALAGRSGVEALHIVSHGMPGTLWLGGTELSARTMDGYAQQLSAWQASLAQDADILIYGCSAGAGAEGAELARMLGELTGADIGASTDFTGGDSAADANWSMEFTWGTVDTSIYGDADLLAEYNSRFSTINLAGNTGWSALLYGSKQDPGGDEQAGKASTDLVGDATHATLYFAYDDKGTAGEADDEIALRFRVSQADSSGGFGAVGMIGVDANLDGDLDIFVGVDARQGPAVITLYNPGTGSNDSPSSTSITPAPDRAYTGTAATYQFLQVAPGTDQEYTAAGTDLDGGGKTDYLVSFKVAFDQIKQELERDNVTGNPTAGITIDRHTPLRFVLMTMTQNNAINGDIGGIAGQNKSTLTWDQLGAFSQLGSFSNSNPIITSGGGGQTASYNAADGVLQVTTITATDSDPGDTLRYSIAGGADAAKFTIDPVTGVLSFVSAQSYTAPTDADGDGRYEVTVKVLDYSDAGATQAKQGSDTQDLVITVVSPPDTTRPTLNLDGDISPSDGQTNVAPNSNIFMTFSEPVQAGTGNIYIRNAVTGAIVQTIPVGDVDQVRFTGSQVQLNPLLDLAANTAYYIEIDAGAFKDLAGNAYVAIDGGSPLLTAGSPAGVNDVDGGGSYKWNFTTGSNSLNDSTPPTLTSTGPADNATGVPPGTNLSLTFSEAVFADNGFFTIRRSSDGAVIARIASSDLTQVTYSADRKTVTINPDADLAENTAYYVTIDAQALQDSSGNHYVGIDELNQGVSNAYGLNFTTGADTAGPTIAYVSASNLDGTWIAGDTIFIRVKFNETVTVTGTPQLALETGSTDRIATYSSGSGSDSLIFSYVVQPGDTSADLNYLATNALSLNGGTIRDAANNNANLTLPALGGTDSLAGRKALVIDAAPVNALPANTNAPNNSAYLFTASVSDVDSPTLTVTLSATNGTLSLSTIAGLAFSAGDGTADGSMTFSGSAANVNAAMAGMSFLATPGYTGPATVTMLSKDGAVSVNGVAVSDTDSFNINVTAPVPALGAAGNTLAYAENDPATPVNPFIAVSYPNETELDGATIQINGNYQNGQDLLEFTNQNGITGSWNAATGTLTLSGTATLAQYQDALRSISYRNTSDAPVTSSRTVSFIVNDGATSSSTVTSTITVAQVDDAPTLGVVRSNATFTQGGPATSLFSAAAVSTIESGQTIQSLVVGVSNLQNGASETLIIDGTPISLTNGASGTTGGLNVSYSVSVSGSIAAVTLTHAGLSTANTQALIDGVQYENSAAAPTSGLRTVTLKQLVDSGSGSAPNANTGVFALSSTVSVVTTNAAPVLGGADPSPTYVENGGGTAVHPAITISDLDSTSLQSATVSITGGFVSGQDVLAFTNQNGIIGSYNAATGVLTLSGSASLADYQAALRSVTYRNTSDAPDTTQRTLTYAASDGSASSGGVTSTLNITAVNDAPSGTDRTAIILQGASYTFSATDFGLSDATDAGAHTLNRVRITTLPGSGTLTNNGVAVNAGDYVPLAAINASQLVFTPSGASGTSFTFQVEDTGGTANSGVNLDQSANTFTITVNTVNQPPVLGGGDPGPTYNEGGAGTAINSTITVTDADTANMNGAVIRITSGFASGDTLNFTNQNGITGTYNPATGILTLSGSATKADYQAALRSITYTSTSDTPTGSRTFSYQVSDGTEFSSAVTSTLTVSTVNDAPVLAGVSTNAIYNGSAVAVHPYIYVSDVDSTTLSAATVSISGFQSGDSLVFTNQNGITGSYNATTGVLTLSGSSSVANYQAALRSIQFSTTSDSIATRTVNFQVNDGGSANNLSNTLAASTINVNGSALAAPVLAVSNTLAYTEGGAAANIDPSLTITDTDSANMAGAIVRISNYVSGQDVLSFTNTANITGVFDSTTGILTLSGTDTKANYEAALRAVKYHNTSATPTTTQRTVIFQVTDGTEASNDLTASIDITATSSNPTSANATFYADRNTDYTFRLADFAFADTDGHGFSSITVTTVPAVTTGGGFFRYNGVAVTTNTVVSAADIAAGLLVWEITSSGSVSTDLFRFQVTDSSGATSTASPAYSMTWTYDAAPTVPALTATVGGTFTENSGTPISVASGIDITAGTNNIDRARINIVNFVPGQDSLSFTGDTSKFTATINGGVLTLTRIGTPTEAEWEAALGQVKYSNSSENPAVSRTVTMQVHSSAVDGNWSNVTSGTIAVGVNDAPVIAGTTHKAFYTQGGSAVAVEPAIILADPDNTTLSGATVSISGGTFSAGDTLSFTDQNGITGSYNSGTGVLTLSGTASLANYQAAIR